MRKRSRTVEDGKRLTIVHVPNKGEIRITKDGGEQTIDTPTRTEALGTDEVTNTESEVLQSISKGRKWKRMARSKEMSTFDQIYYSETIPKRKFEPMTGQEVERGKNKI